MKRVLNDMQYITSFISFSEYKAPPPPPERSFARRVGRSSSHSAAQQGHTHTYVQQQQQVYMCYKLSGINSLKALSFSLYPGLFIHDSGQSSVSNGSELAQRQFTRERESQCREHIVTTANKV